MADSSFPCTARAGNCSIGSIPAETAIRTATIQYGSVGATVYADSGWTGILR